MEKYTGFIYKAYCLITKKSYIGQISISIDHRKNQHLWSSFNENDNLWHLYFHKAIRKHGIDNFGWGTLEAITSNSKENLYECLDNLEVKYIQQYDSYYNGYNLTLGGNIARYSAKKITVYDSNNQILSYFNSSKEVSQHFGVSEDLVTEEDLKKIKKEVYKILAINSRTKENIGIYNSYTEASKALNIAVGSISNCCKRKLKSAGKVNGIKIFWEYVA